MMTDDKRFSQVRAAIRRHACDSKRALEAVRNVEVVGSSPHHLHSGSAIGAD
jgi:hypothetical protein